MVKIFLIAILFAPGGEQYRDFVQSYDTLAQCETQKKAAEDSAAKMPGFAVNARCVTVKFGPSV